MRSSGGASAIVADLRDAWAQRGTDWWTEDPTDRAGDGWIRIDQLGADPERLGHIVVGYQRLVQAATRKAGAALLAKRLTSILVLPPTVAWLSWHRVPTLLPDETWIQFHPKLGPIRLAVKQVQGMVLAEDPLASSPDCVVAETDDELREHLAATTYDATMGAVIEAIATKERTGRRHLWGNVALVAVNSAMWAGNGTDPWGRGRQLCESRRVLNDTQRVVPCERSDAGEFLLALRSTCCLAYEVESHGYCASCSLLDYDDRVANLTSTIGDLWRDRAR